jgi:hypothetical protein
MDVGTQDTSRPYVIPSSNNGLGLVEQIGSCVQRSAVLLAWFPKVEVSSTNVSFTSYSPRKKEELSSSS